jgi:type IV secretory pathway ATPase VirB11/archaellum biosynthesis ATPase
MFRLRHALKHSREAGSLNERINLFGFIDDHTFLTKSGDVGVALAVRGVDYECLDANGIDNFTKRLESAFKTLDDRCRIYQYLFKRNAPDLPHQTYPNPIVSAAIESRIAYLKGKADSLYALDIYFVVLFETSRAKEVVLRTFSTAGRKKSRAWSELQAFLSTQKQVLLLQNEIHDAQAALGQKVSSFIQQVNDFLQVQLLERQETFRVLKRILNFAPHKLRFAEIKHDTFLDYYLCESHLECHRRFLRVDDFYTKVLTLKEPTAQSFPLIFLKLLDVQANFFITTEWRKEEGGKTRSRIHSRRRHFHNTKRSFVSYLNTSEAPVAAQDILIDDSKEAQIQNLGQALKELEVNGNYFGEFSLIVVVYDTDLSKVEAACAEFYKVFSVHDAQLYEERYNQLNAYLATVPGNSAFNLRRLYITNANHADYSFLFTLHSGDPVNQHLRQEYLALLETSHHTPYFLNLHHRDIAHTVILGRTGSGKTTILTALSSFIPQHERVLVIEDTAEIQIQTPNLVRFEARREQNGFPAVTIRQLLKASLRHRPDRILLGEIRGAEAFDLLQLLNTGHSGTISTVHANSAVQALSRFTSCVLQSGVELPYRAIKNNIADSLNMLVHLERRPGRRFVSEVAEICGYEPEPDRYDLKSLFLRREDKPCLP